MVKVIWTPEAISERNDIFRYWNKRNNSDHYSKKLRSLIRTAIQTIRQHPEIGKPTRIANTRVKIIVDYFLVYRTSDIGITILAIWDSRQNPIKLDKIID
jgi:addiction module RelE/StbE family toxin